jgi:hypothetical protein
MAVVRKRTIPTERPPLVGEVAIADGFNMEISTTKITNMAFQRKKTYTI